MAHDGCSFPQLLGAVFFYNFMILNLILALLEILFLEDKLPSQKSKRLHHVNFEKNNNCLQDMPSVNENTV